MRGSLVCMFVVASSAHADVTVGAAIGAGAQGVATYSALDVRLDAAWQADRVGLGARGVWDGAEFRTRDWSSPWDAIAIVRDVEATRDVGDVHLGVAAGALAPAQLGHIVDGYRVAIDDRWRTGVRLSATDDVLAASAEIDDVLDPALIGGGMRYQMAPPWGMHAAFAIDPAGGNAFEVGADRRYGSDTARVDVGVSVVAEILRGASAVAFADSAIDRDGIRFTLRGDVRAGTGSAGSLFGPLYRIERLAHDGEATLWARARSGELAGAAAGIAMGVARDDFAGWLELGARSRPGLGPIVTASGGAPMNRWLQAALWTALGTDDAAGAAELRVAWARTLFSALQAARIYRLDEMQPYSVWSVSAWFGATTP